eukprot:277944-Pyramimonas_sp.AAC.1
MFCANFGVRAQRPAEAAEHPPPADTGAGAYGLQPFRSADLPDVQVRVRAHERRGPRAHR